MAKKIKTHYDDGGDVDFDSDLEPITPTATYMGGDNSGAPTASDISGLTSGASTPTVDASGLPSSVSATYNSADAPSGASSSALSAALKALGLGGGNTSNTAVLGALTGLLSAYGTAKNTQAKGTLPSLPVLPGSTSAAGYGPAGGYGFGNYAGATGSTPGIGYAPVAQAAPKPTSSYYTYGQGPQQQQFQQVNGGAPITPLSQADGGHISMATGGHVAKFDMGGQVNPVQRPVMPPQGGALSAPAMGAPTPPQVGTPRPITPQIPQIPQRAPVPPQAPQSVMAQRMIAARPQVPGNRFADGGFVNQMTPNTAQIPGPQMVQSQGVPQQGSGLAQRLAGFHRGVPAQGHSPGLADGGALSTANPQSGVSRHITGPGDGTSDSIPARLANGEYVIDAQAVSMLGNGDNSAGAKRLDEFRKNLRQHKGGALAKGKMAPDAKPVHKYMGGK